MLLLLSPISTPKNPTRNNFEKLYKFSAQAKKYKELKKREDQIEDYLSKHGSLLSEEKEAKQIHEENIVKLLEAISTGLSRAKMLPSVTDFKDLKDDLDFKATEADRAKDTLDTLETDKTKLKSDFNKLEQLEAKINSEMVRINSLQCADVVFLRQL